MSDIRIKCHPTLGILVGTDGHVMAPASGKHPARWTFGSKHSMGYRQVSIAGKHYLVHRLVAETFLGGIPEGMEIDHINRNKADNRVDNLRIVTRSENHRNTSYHDRVDARCGTHKYEDYKQYQRERNVRRRKTHKQVRFSDGKNRWVLNEEARELLKLPVKERVY